MQTTDYFSKKVALVSFVMAIFVVYIHANNLLYYGIEPNCQVLPSITVNIIGEILGGMAVPFFFMMSAYWIFRFDVYDSDAMSILLKKLKKKVKTICVPYLIWNTFGTAFYMIATHIPFVVKMMNYGETISITFSNVMEGVFFHKYYFTFWYLQDLIVLTAISPILLLLLKNRYLALITIAFSGIAILLNVDFVLFSGTSFLFFIIGAYIVTYGKNCFENRSNKPWRYLLIFVLMRIISYMDIPIVAEVFFFISPVLLWKGMDVFLPSDFYKRKLGWFMTQSFFIYSSHVIPVTIIGHLLAKISQTYFWATISYLIAPWITLGVIYIVAKILCKYTPTFYGLICGGRT